MTSEFEVKNAKTATRAPKTVGKRIARGVVANAKWGKPLLAMLLFRVMSPSKVIKERCFQYFSMFAYFNGNNSRVL